MFNTISKYLEQHALRRTREVLLSMSDRQLEDVGFSRDLLSRGVSYWPWREETADNYQSKQQQKMTTTEINQAISELSDMSDKELWDLGINRGSIRQAVTSSPEDRAA